MLCLIILILFLFLFFHIINLSGGNNNLSLDEVMLHEALEVEVGELIILADLEELGELLIGVDLATISLVLKTVSVDVGVDLLAHLSAGHLSANGLAEKGSELVTDAGRLDEARGLAVATVLALLGGKLLGSLHLTGNRLLKGLEVVLEGGEEANHLLELGAVLRHLEGEVGNIGLNSGGSSGGGSSGNRSGLNLRGSDLLGAGGLGSSLNNRGRGRSGGSRNRLSSSNHAS